MNARCSLFAAGVSGESAAATMRASSCSLTAAVARVAELVARLHGLADGVGEGGAIGPGAAVANAVNDALRPLGVEILHSPISPRRLVEAVLAARDAKRARA